MKLIHSKCLHDLVVVDLSLEVIIVEFGLEDGYVFPNIYDISTKKDKGFEFKCPKCKKGSVDTDEISIVCPKCGSPTSIRNLFEIRGKYNRICEKCYKYLVEKFGDSLAGIKHGPLTVKL